MKNSSKNNKDYRNRYPEKRLAHSKVNGAIRAGILLKEPCFCGVVKAEAHHDDYSKPLDVIWLCRKHHIQRHKELGTGKTLSPKTTMLAEKIKPLFDQGLNFVEISKVLGVPYNRVYKAHRKINRQK